MNWQNLLQAEMKKPYLLQTMEKIQQERDAGKIVYPPSDQIFEAFTLTPFEKVKVVILGQDPYHGENQAHGLAFSVQQGVAIPPSLRNIYKELTADIEGFQTPTHGNLSAWASQGVLMLNTVLTVEAGLAHSHAKLGWETFTDEVLNLLNREHSDLVFMLWGAHAIKKGQLIDRNRHLVLEAVHPSPLSARRGFFGCQHFSKTNQWLTKKGQSSISWQLPG